MTIEVGLMLQLIISVVSVGIMYGILKTQVDYIQKAIDKLELKQEDISLIKTTLAVMRAEIKQIKEDTDKNTDKQL